MFPINRQEEEKRLKNKTDIFWSKKAERILLLFSLWLSTPHVQIMCLEINNAIKKYILTFQVNQNKWQPKAQSAPGCHPLNRGTSSSLAQDELVYCYPKFI